jgi:cytochrome c oxidase subunit 2
MPLRKPLPIGLSLLLTLASTPLAAEDSTGARLYSPCATCHGPDAQGNAELHAPRLAGRPEWYVARQLRNFRSRLRGTDENDVYGNQMARMAEQLWDDGEVAAVASYVSSLQGSAPSKTLRGKASRGESAFSVCAACHGERGVGNADLGAPPLIDLDDWTIVTELEAFRDGLRGTSPDDTFGQQMRAAVAAVPNDVAFDDLAAFIGTLAEPARTESRRKR